MFKWYKHQEQQTCAAAWFSASSFLLVAGKKRMLSMVWMSSNWTTHFISNEENNSWSDVTSAQKHTCDWLIYRLDKIIKITKSYNDDKLIPTEVSHLDVVVGLCSDDPKDFYKLEDRSILRADQIRENIYYTLPVLPCWFRLYSRLRLYSCLLTTSQPLFTASQSYTAL